MSDVLSETTNAKWYQAKGPKRARILWGDETQWINIRPVSYAGVEFAYEAVKTLQTMNRTGRDLTKTVWARLDEWASDCITSWRLVATEDIEGVCRRGEAVPQIGTMDRQQRLLVWDTLSSDLWWRLMNGSAALSHRRYIGT